MIRLAAQVVLPVSRFPESETFHGLVIITHGRVAIRCAFQIQINKLFEIRANNLIRIDEDNLFEVHREQDIQEENLVTPNDTLLLLLGAEPRGPFVCDELILETVFLREVWNEFLFAS